MANAAVTELRRKTDAAYATHYHWNDHAGQLAKIRKAVGLPEAK